MDQEKIYDIIGSELSGHSTKIDKELLQSWLEESPTNVKTYQMLKESWENTRIEVGYPEEDAQFDKVLHKINNRGRVQKSFIAAHFLKIAASVSILMVSAWFVFQGNEASKEVADTPAIIEKSNPAGQKSSFNLPDGTKVWLNAESSLTYTGDYGKSDRKVALEGEAFFDVKKDSARQFVVVSGNFTTTALGTSFNVRDYPNENQLQVALVTGKVRIDQFITGSLSEIATKTYLRPGEQITYSQESNIYKKENFDSKRIASWKDGTLYFEDDCFNDIVKNLERWYGVQIYVNNPPQNGQLLFSGEFNNETLTNVLNAMSYSNKFEYSLDEKNIKIKFN